MIALLGRRVGPTDGVEDYCNFLGQALGRRGVELKKVRLEWMDEGWARTLWKLRRKSAEWRGAWVVLQYTALGWSRHGFPIWAPATLATLRRGGARCAVVFHEPCGVGGPRWIDRIRGACQEWIVRALHHRADKSIFTVPLQTIDWLPKDSVKAAFIPIGANIPEPAPARVLAATRKGAGKIVAIFCLSDPPNRRIELDDISQAVRTAITNGAHLRVVFLGKGTAEAQNDIESAFARIPVEVSNLGLQDAGEISRILCESDVMLCVRGSLYPRRGSALAGIACGLPIIGYAGGVEGTPLAEAGIELVPYRDSEAMGRALAHVVSDRRLEETLRAKNRGAQETYFSWNVIARKFQGELDETRGAG
jgi:glycosyltransferase involved in cell wall biosynthesis